MGKPNRRRILWGGGLALVGSGSGTPQRNVNCNCASGSDGMPLDTGTSKIRPVMERYEVELRDLNRLFALPGSHTCDTSASRFLYRTTPLAGGHQLGCLEPGGETQAKRAAQPLTEYLIVLNDEREVFLRSLHERSTAVPIAPLGRLPGRESRRHVAQ